MIFDDDELTLLIEIVLDVVLVRLLWAFLAALVVVVVTGNFLIYLNLFNDCDDMLLIGFNSFDFNLFNFLPFLFRLYLMPLILIIFTLWLLLSLLLLLFVSLNNE